MDSVSAETRKTTMRTKTRTQAERRSVTSAGGKQVLTCDVQGPLIGCGKQRLQNCPAIGHNVGHYGSLYDMKLLALAVFAALFAIATCQVYYPLDSDPDKPQWPSTYSATVEWRSNHHPHHKFFRMFWDEKNCRARVGGMVKWKGKHYKMEALYYGKKNAAYYIFYERDQVKCFTMDLKNKTIKGLDLSDADYKGMALVEYHPVYHWEKDIETKGDDKKKAHIRVFDTQEDREIKKLDYSMHDENKIGSMLFHEVNYGPQADSLFKIPKLVMEQCTEKLEDVDIYDITDPVALLAQIPH